MGFITDKKKEEKIEEPEFYLSATKVKVPNYKVCKLKPQEKTLYFSIAFVIGGVVGYLFYGGIGKNEFGPTALTIICDILAVVIVGTVAGFLFLKIITESKLEKRKRELAKQFRDMLDVITTSIGAGKNVPDSFIAARNDLAVQYDSDADILTELDVIIGGMTNNIPLEDMLEDFGARSGIDDITSFANVFRISYRKGGNIRDVIRNTHAILSDKMQIKEEIETLVTSNKFEQNIMNVMPIMLVALIKFSSPEFAQNFTTPTGIASTTVAVVLFVFAYFLGRKLLKIDV